MRNKKPPFEITNQIIDYVAEIAELVGRLTVTSPLYPQVPRSDAPTASELFMVLWPSSRTPFPWSR